MPAAGRCGCMPSMYLSRTALGTAVVVLLALSVPASTNADETSQQGRGDAVGRGCRPGQGVTVVVDFATADGDRVRIGCAKGAQRNGFAALRKAGFAVSRVPIQPLAACRIDGFPAEGYPHCWWSGYWSYWRSNGMSSYRYASVGAASQGPIAVDRVEGWRFELLDDPRLRPQLRVDQLPAYRAARIGTGPARTHDSTFGKRPRLRVSVRSGPMVSGKVRVYDGRTLLRQASLVRERATLRWSGQALEPGRHRLTVRYLGSNDVAKGKARVVWKVRARP